MDKINKETENFKPCGKGENTCNCKNASECGYLTNKTPLEEMLDKEFPLLSQQEFNSKELEFDDEDFDSPPYRYEDYLFDMKEKRKIATQFYLAAQSSIKQEQKPSDEFIKNKAALYLVRQYVDYGDLNEKAEHQILDAYIAGSKMICDAFSSPSKEIDWDKIAYSLQEQSGESLVEGGDENNPYDWYLEDLTVNDIVEWLKQRPEFSKTSTEKVNYKEIDKTLAIEFADWLPQNAAIAEDEYYWISLKDGKTISVSELYDLFLSQKKGHGE